MRTILCLTVFAAAALAQGSPKQNDAQLEALLKRWEQGDAAAKERVLEEIQKLGKPALRKILGRIRPAKPRAPQHFEAPRLGIKHPEAAAPDKEGKLVLLEVRLCKGGRPAVLQNEVAALLTEQEAATALKRAETLAAPTLTAFQGQRASITVTEQIPFVQTRDKTQQPVLGTVDAGTTVQCVSRLLASGSIRLEMLFQEARLQTPMARIRTQGGDVDAPSVLTKQISLTIDVEQGKLAAVKLPEGGESNWVLIKPVALDPMPPAKPLPPK